MRLVLLFKNLCHDPLRIRDGDENQIMITVKTMNPFLSLDEEKEMEEDMDDIIEDEEDEDDDDLDDDFDYFDNEE